MVSFPTMRTIARGALLAVLPALAQGGIAEAAPIVTVAVSFASLGAKTFRRIAAARLEQRALLRLVQGGFAVVAAEANPEIEITVREGPGTLLLDGRAAGVRLSRRVRLRGPLRVLHLAVSQKIVELARALRVAALRVTPLPTAPSVEPPGRASGPPAPPAPAPSRPVPGPPGIPVTPRPEAETPAPRAGSTAPAPRPEPAAPAPRPEPAAPAPRPEPAAPAPRPEPAAPAPRPEPAKAAPEPPTRAESPESTLGALAPAGVVASGFRLRPELAVGSGFLVRSGGTDPVFHFLFRLGWWRALGARLAVSFVPASAGPASVQEWFFQVGPTYRLSLPVDLELDFALLAGVLLHRFDVGGAATNERSGSRLDPTVSLPVTLAWRAWRGLRVMLRVAPAIARTHRSHELAGATVWERGRIHLEAGAGIAWLFR